MNSENLCVNLRCDKKHISQCAPWVKSENRWQQNSRHKFFNAITCEINKVSLRNLQRGKYRFYCNFSLGVFRISHPWERASKQADNKDAITREISLLSHKIDFYGIDIYTVHSQFSIHIVCVVTKRSLQLWVPARVEHRMSALRCCFLHSFVRKSIIFHSFISRELSQVSFHLQKPTQQISMCSADCRKRLSAQRGGEEKATLSFVSPLVLWFLVMATHTHNFLVE